MKKWFLKKKNYSFVKIYIIKISYNQTIINISILLIEKYI